MTGKLSDLSAEDRELLTDEELAAWEEIDGIEAGENGGDEDQGVQDTGETDEERDARIEQEEAAAREAEEEANRVAAEEAKKAAAKPKKEEPKPEKTPEELEAEASAAAEPENKPEPVSRAPRPLFNAQLPADLADQRSALDARDEELAKKFDEGDITTAEFQKGLREISREHQKLDRIELKAELAAESTQNRFEEDWETTATNFIAAHPEINKNQTLLGSFDNVVRQVTAKTMQAGGTPGLADLQRAHKQWSEDMGFTQQPAEPAGKKGTLPTPPKNVPPTLANVPAAGANDTDDGKFAYLDNLNGEDFERALDKLSPSEQAAYYAS